MMGLFSLVMQRDTPSQLLLIHTFRVLQPLANAKWLRSELPKDFVVQHSKVVASEPLISHVKSVKVRRLLNA